MTDIRLDWQRAARTGVPEAVFCAGKSVGQIAEIVGDADAAGLSLLLTRLSQEQHGALTGPSLDYDPVSLTAMLDHGLPDLTDSGVAVVAAGTSDAPIAHEARRTLEFSGVLAPTYVDCGVAGLWRLTEVAEHVQDRRVVIAVAGFEGALFSVLAGLIPAPVIAVPASVGYGVSADGKAALSSALATCAPGVTTVNIDNGYGAATAALKMLAALDRPPKQELPT
jgi:NCAIR mutase (PurE)-related protein